jgi:hypothetical protein
VLGQSVCSCIAMENADYACSLRVGDVCTGVVLRLPGMDDDGPAHLRGQTDLRSESGALGDSGRIIVVVIEAAFADRNGGGHELAQSRDVALFVEAGGIVGMDSGGGEHEAGMLGRVFTRESRCLQRLSDADDGRRARIAGAGDYRVAVAGERRVCEVGMAVDEDLRTPPVLRGHWRSIQRSTGAAM